MVRADIIGTVFMVALICGFRLCPLSVSHDNLFSQFSFHNGISLTLYTKHSLLQNCVSNTITRHSDPTILYCYSANAPHETLPSRIENS